MNEGTHSRYKWLRARIEAGGFAYAAVGLLLGALLDEWFGFIVVAMIACGLLVAVILRLRSGARA